MESAYPIIKNNRSKTIVCIVDDLQTTRDTKFHRFIEKSCDIKYVKLKTIPELFDYVSKKEVPEVVLIAVRKLFNEGIDLYDVVNSITTLFRCKGIIEDMPKIGAIVDADEDVRLINELIRCDIKIIAPDFNFTSNEIIDSINDMLMKGTHVPKKIMERIVKDRLKNKKNSKDADIINLTPRQEQILNLICSKGCSNKMIGKILNLSESTVKLHVGTVLKKYGLKNRTQLVLMIAEKKNIN